MRFVGSLNTDKFSDSGKDTRLKNAVKYVKVQQ
jgi:hypothetical protein